MGPLQRFKSLGFYSLIPLTVILLVLEHNAVLSPRGHAALLIVIVIGIGLLARDWMAHSSPIE